MGQKVKGRVCAGWSGNTERGDNHSELWIRRNLGEGVPSLLGVAGTEALRGEELGQCGWNAEGRDRDTSQRCACKRSHPTIHAGAATAPALGSSSHLTMYGICHSNSSGLTPVSFSEFHTYHSTETPGFCLVSCFPHWCLTMKLYNDWDDRQYFHLCTLGISVVPEAKWAEIICQT
jgi:hypothetical protein